MLSALKLIIMEDIIIKVHANPKSSKNQIVGWKEDVLYIKITAPPVEGAANEAIVKFLSKELKIKKSQVSLASGDHSREKRFIIKGVTEEYIKEVLK